MKLTRSVRITGTGTSLYDIRRAAKRLSEFLDDERGGSSVNVSFFAIRTARGPYRQDKVSVSAKITENL